MNPPTAGGSALAPRLVTPQNLEELSVTPGRGRARGERAPSDSVVRPSNFTGSRNPADEAWRQEVLERVRKRRQVRTHALPLFADRDEKPAEIEEEEPSQLEVPATPVPTTPGASLAALPLDVAIVDHLAGVVASIDPRPAPRAPDIIASLPVEPAEPESEDMVMDLPLRPAEAASVANRPEDPPRQTLVERARPSLVLGSAGPRSLVADLPLVEPSPADPTVVELPQAVPRDARNPRAAAMGDRLQAAFIDVGLWSFTCVSAFYFAGRIARTSILGLAPAWPGLALFALVIAAAYVLFFGGLTGATPGKIACGIQVRRYDGSPLGPLASLGRGGLGLLSVALLGVGVWPAFWDRDRRTLHDRATQSRVTLV